MQQIAVWLIVWQCQQNDAEHCQQSYIKQWGEGIVCPLKCNYTETENKPRSTEKHTGGMLNNK